MPVKSQRKALKISNSMSRHITSAVKLLKKEIDRLQNEAKTWQLRESIAKENRENTLKQIEKLEAQIAELSPEEQEHE